MIADFVAVYRAEGKRDLIVIAGPVGVGLADSAVNISFPCNCLRRIKLGSEIKQLQGGSS